MTAGIIVGIVAVATVLDIVLALVIGAILARRSYR